jgi:hypothetical protein
MFVISTAAFIRSRLWPAHLIEAIVAPVAFLLARLGLLVGGVERGRFGDDLIGEVRGVFLGLVVTSVPKVPI